MSRLSKPARPVRLPLVINGVDRLPGGPSGARPAVTAAPLMTRESDMRTGLKHLRHPQVHPLQTPSMVDGLLGRIMFGSSRGPARLALIGLLTVAMALGCDDLQGPAGPGPGEPPPAPGPTPEVLGALIVSNPAVGEAAGAQGALLLSSADLVYVSLPPGSVPTGERVAIVTRGTGARTSTAMIDGGFDPVVVAASAGDTLELRIELHGNGGDVDFVSEVPQRKPPVLVRTDPPPMRQDVPLNAVLLLVFSEPIDGASLTSSSVQLLLDGVPVAGAVELFDAAHLTATFTPASPLVPSANYTLQATQAIQDLDGDGLEAAATVAFTTGSSAQTLQITAFLNDGHQSVGVLRAGAFVNAAVTVNGSGLSRGGIAGCTAGECMNYYHGALSLGVGSLVTVQVRTGGLTVLATGNVPETPIITAPAVGATFLLADSIPIAWTSTTDPGSFWVGVSNGGFCCGFLDAPPGAARDLKVAASDIYVDFTTSSIWVGALNEGSFSGPADPQSIMEMWASTEVAVAIEP